MEAVSEIVTEHLQIDGRQISLEKRKSREKKTLGGPHESHGRQAKEAGHSTNEI